MVRGFHFTRQKNGKTTQKGLAKIILKSVGKATVENLPCRWIELEFQGDESLKIKYSAWKFLIPEKEFSAGGDPLSHVKEAWREVDGETAQKLSLEYVKGDVRTRNDFWLPPMIANLKRTEERQTVDWQQGRLECEVFEGTQHLKYRRENVEVMYRLSINDKVPFGVAASRLKMHDHVDGVEDVKGSIEFTMTDMGKNAVSKVKHLP